MFLGFPGEVGAVEVADGAPGIHEELTDNSAIPEAGASLDHNYES